ncbi:MAG: acetoacetate--CoA ligase [Actinobacteria bacterium]|nr:acetoacetate--CoA ligase [Actinomycetota bacterium]MCG2819633.1 acetoacetate--CoA ligase [Actinomycetes bacterium]MBU4217401.1 acetoacetate--CoA ligase [Actinomycetota bacterium]MBU4359963.1 acetoacetate--CoA ligase [Actinomycetota bacterium]MBU4393161.1 acetoacetate--CoA ligase [Actinomycetota bacterium]
MAKLLWKPSEERVKGSNMYSFMQYINRRFDRDFSSYDELYQWSVDNIPDFWAAMWEFADIKASSDYEEVIDDVGKMPGAKWFTGARLNFAENLLRYRDDRVALIFKGEGQDIVKMTYAELYDQVARVAESLREAGVKVGDRVVGFMPNMPQAVVAMLAATSMGAVWSSCSPDFGIKGVLDRFGQIKPRILFVADGYFFKGRKLDSLERVADIIENLPSIEKVVVTPYINEEPDISGVRDAVSFDEFKSGQDNLEVEFEQLPFDHPLYIMFTSGTTGLPKCMVQSAGGILIHHLKELVLHTNLTRDDSIFYFTTCGWMMWNWLVSALAVGAELVLYDGNPFYPDPGVLWEMAQEVGLTVFGTSAGYVAALMKEGLKPGEEYDLSSLESVLSTGSPLSEEAFEWIYQEVKPDIQLASISGGSDINGCFACGDPMGPVYSGELQCRALAMKVEAFDVDGNPVVGEQGELVCTAPSPSMPIYFWEDPDGAKYHRAYFDVYDNVWKHGDFILINERGGVIIYGRSDATLNPGGVRIGTAEIYRLVDLMDEVQDCIVVGQNWKNDVRVILFVQMAPGYELTDELKNSIRKRIRAEESPRHVPAKIIAVPDIPYTINMKKVELSVKKVIEGEPVKNKDALKNPEALDYYENIPELQED